LLIAAVLLRDRGDRTLGRLGAVLLVGAAAAAICAAPTFPRPWQWWSLVLLALSSGAIVVFWLWARAAFDDDFVLRRWHGARYGRQLSACKSSSPAGPQDGPRSGLRSTKRCRSPISASLCWLRRRRL
jgi:hypothetical protein